MKTGKKLIKMGNFINVRTLNEKEGEDVKDGNKIGSREGTRWHTLMNRSGVRRRKKEEEEDTSTGMQTTLVCFSCKKF